MNSLPETVTRQRRDCDLNPGHSAPESSTLTTRLPSHPRVCVCVYLPANRTCSEHEFRCSNSACIDSSMMCDSVNDCGDASDERDTICRKEKTAELTLASLASSLSSVVSMPDWSISVCNKPTRSTQPCILPGSRNRVPASAGVSAGCHLCRVAGNTV